MSGKGSTKICFYFAADRMNRSPDTNTLTLREFVFAQRELIKETCKQSSCILAA